MSSFDRLERPREGAQDLGSAALAAVNSKSKDCRPAGTCAGACVGTGGRGSVPRLLREKDARCGGRIRRVPLAPAKRDQAGNRQSRNADGGLAVCVVVLGEGGVHVQGRDAKDDDGAHQRGGAPVA